MKFKTLVFLKGLTRLEKEQGPIRVVAVWLSNTFRNDGQKVMQVLERASLANLHLGQL